MTDVLVGLDPSPLRLGWAAVTIDDGTPVAYGTEDISVPGHGWADTQIVYATQRIWRQLDHGGHHVTAWTREEPMTRFPSVAKQHGYTCGLVDAMVRRQWPWAIVITPVGPTEWRRLCGLPGNAPKTVVLGVARGLTSIDLDDQDAADALLVARAAWRQWTDRDDAA